MIPDAIAEMTNTSLSGKVVTLIGFKGMGKEAAQAIRDVSGGKVIIVETEPNLAVTAQLNAFDVKNMEQAFAISDFVMLVKDQKLNFDIMTKAKNNCVFGCLYEDPIGVNIDIESFYKH